MMEITVNNDICIIKNPTSDLKAHLSVQFGYKDKSKEFQLRRMASNPFQKKSPLYSKLKSEMNGSMLNTASDGSLFFSSGLIHIIQEFDSSIVIKDNRKDTGLAVSYPWKKKPFSLRDYQQEALDVMVDSRRGIVNFATGLGKTLTAVHAIREFKKKTLIICPGKSIAKQFYNELVSAFGEDKIGFYGDGKKKIKQITVGIAQSVNNNVDKFKEAKLGLIIVDEVHHIAATTFFNIVSNLGDTGRIFGLTATDYRADGKDIMIEAGCGPVLIRRDVVWGVKHKWLAEPIFIMRNIDTAEKNYRADRLKNYKFHVLKNQLMKDAIAKDALNSINKGKSTLILVDQVEHGEELSKYLGVPFATGKDKKSQEYVDQLNDGSIPGLVGTAGKIGEGTDTKNVDVLIMASFNASKGAVIQSLGRGLRKQGTKTHCIIMDYCPMGSTMLTRHAGQRIEYYREITSNVKII